MRRGTVRRRCPIPAFADVPIRPAATVMLRARHRWRAGGVHAPAHDQRGVRQRDVRLPRAGRLDEADGEGDEGYLVARDPGVLRGGRRAARRGGRRRADQRRPPGARPSRRGARRLAEHPRPVRASTACAWRPTGWPTSPTGSRRRARRRGASTPASSSPSHPPAQTHTHDDNETVASEWVRPADALARGRAGEMALMPPTVATLEFLAEHATAEAALVAGRAVGEPPVILPKIRWARRGDARHRHARRRGLRLARLTQRLGAADGRASPGRPARALASSSAATISDSTRAEQPAMFTGGATSVTIRSAMARNASAAGPSPCEHHRLAGVAAGGDRRLERHLAEQLDADLVGQRLPAARAEQRVRLAVVAGERAHVLDHAGARAGSCAGPCRRRGRRPSGRRAPAW